MKKIWSIFGNVTYWIVWPLLFLYLYSTDRTRVIIVYKKQVLLLKNWLGRNEWGLPGGGVHKGEKVEIAAIREVREETGLELEENDLNKLDLNITADAGFKYNILGFIVDLNQKAPLVKARAEVSELRWVKISELNKLKLSKNTRVILETWLAKGHLLD